MTDHGARCYCDACWPARLGEMRELVAGAARRLGQELLGWAREPLVPALVRAALQPVHRDVKPSKESARSPRPRARGHRPATKGPPSTHYLDALDDNSISIEQHRRDIAAARAQVPDPPPSQPARRRSRRPPPRNRRRRALVEIAAATRDRVAELRAIAERDRAEWRSAATTNPDRTVEPDRLEMGDVNP